jgi:chorismate mutase
VRGEACVAAAPPVSCITQRTCAPCVLAILLSVLLAGCAAQPPAVDIEKIDRVLTLIQQRLGYMEDVARNKWNSGAPIEDLPREREIIAGIGLRAAGYGLDAEIAQDFFRAQIEASKVMQNARFREWRVQNQPPFRNLPDLRDEIRPALDALTPMMMSALAAALPVLRAPGAPRVIDARAAAIVTGAPAAAPALETAIAPLKRVSSRR